MIFSAFGSYFDEDGRPTTIGQLLLQRIAGLDSPVFSGVPQVPVYLVAQLPQPVAGGVIYVADAAGGPVLAFSDGANWLRVTDRSVVT